MFAFVDQQDNWTWFVYNADNEVIRREDAAGGVSTNTYNSDGELSQSTDRDGRTISYVYNADGQPTSEVWQNASAVTVNVITYSYDSSQRLTAAQDSFGGVSYSYDSSSRKLIAQVV